MQATREEGPLEWSAGSPPRPGEADAGRWGQAGSLHTCRTLGHTGWRSASRSSVEDRSPRKPDLVSLLRASLYPTSVFLFGPWLPGGWRLGSSVHLGPQSWRGTSGFATMMRFFVEGGRLSVFVDTSSTHAPAPRLGHQPSLTTAWWPEAWPPPRCPRWPVSPATTADG